MRLKTTIETIVTEKEWNTLVAAKITLVELCHLLQNYEGEADSIKNAISSLDTVMNDIIDDYE